MATFTGIPADGLFLLMQNRFEDSKEFYDAHKAQLGQLVLEPVGQMVEALAPEISALDGDIVVAPARIISRVRRDTRFSKDKTCYRSNVWFCFTRPRVEYPHVWPLFWFEVKPEDSVWNAGVGLWDSPPTYMRFMKERMLAQPGDFLAATAEAIAAGAGLHTEAYKKNRAPDDTPEALVPYFNAKSFFFMAASNDMKQLQSPELVGKLQAYYAGFHAMYRWLRQCAEEYISTIES